MTFIPFNKELHCFKSCSKEHRDSGLCHCYNNIMNSKNTSNKFFVKFINNKKFLLRNFVDIGKKFIFIYPDVEIEQISTCVSFTRSFDIVNSNHEIFNSDYCFQIIGEISPEAIWVKENDEFEEYEEWWFSFKTNKFIDQYKDTEWDKELERRNEYKRIIKLKCNNCQIFH